MPTADPIVTKSDPDQLRAIESLRRDGWTDEDVRRFLRISRRTWHRRKAELRRIREGRSAGG